MPVPRQGEHDRRSLSPPVTSCCSLATHRRLPRRTPPAGGNPKAELAVELVLEKPPGGLDDAARGDVADITRDERRIDLQRVGDRYGRGEHPRPVPSAARAGAYLIANVAASAPQGVGERMSDRDATEVGVSIDPPQDRFRNSTVGKVRAARSASKPPYVVTEGAATREPLGIEVSIATLSVVLAQRFDERLAKPRARCGQLWHRSILDGGGHRRARHHRPARGARDRRERAT